MDKNQKRVTLITGASSGVGRELAICLSKDQRIILNGRDENRLHETYRSCDNNPLIWKYDLENIDDIEHDFSEWIAKNDVEITSFVHCAGIFKMLPIKSINSNNMNKIFAVNIFAPALITKMLAMKRINRKNLKSVVFISSNISNRGAAAFSVYGASKSALDGLMRNLAVELAPNVRVNSVLPGGMITEMTKDIYDDSKMKVEFEKNTPLGIGTPAEIVNVVDFLLSDKSSWITGQQITVDGGRAINITERSSVN